MKRWNPFGKIDMEVGSFLEKSPFNKDYGKDDNNSMPNENDKQKVSEGKKNDDK
jgi:hypothetical protein